MDIKYIITGYTQSMPPRVIKKEDGYIYELLIKLALDPASGSGNNPLFLRLNYPDNKEQPVIFDVELSQITNGLFPEYVTEIEVKRKGEVRITIGDLGADGAILFDDTNPHRTKMVKLE